MDARVKNSLPVHIWLLFAAAVGVTLWTFWGGIAELAWRWGNEEEYSHGFFIPLVSAYLIYQQRHRLLHEQWQPSFWGVGLVAAAMGVYLVGEVSALYLLIHYALVAVIAGFALALLGWRLFKIVAAPIALLLFCIPIPYFLEAELTAGLQLLSSELGAYVLRLFAVPVYLDGNIIDLGVYKLQVVEACSGLNYLFPLLGLGFIAALMFKAPLWQRALLVLSTIPITIAMNSFRIATVGVLVKWYGTSVAEGFLHDFQGWILFVVCTAILVGQMWLMARLRGQKFRDVFDVSMGQTGADARDRSEPFLPGATAQYRNFALAVAAVAVVSTVTLSVDRRPETVPSRQSFALFPMSVEDWQGSRGQLDDETISTLKLNDYLLARYSSTQAEPVELYLAYYDSQRKGASPHSPRVCLPGGGWEIASIERTIRDLPGQTQLPVNRALMRKGEQQLLVYYWFQQRGRTLNNEYLMKWYLFRDALMMNRTDGALVRVTTPVLDNSDLALEEADARLQGLIGALLSTMDDYIPGAPGAHKGFASL